jgi:biotin carboxylase
VLPSATYRAPDFLDAAARLGAEVVVGSEHRQALSGSMGDRAVTLTLSQPEMAADQIERFAKRAPLDAIVAVDDGGTRAAATAAKRLGLRGNAPEAVARAREKAAMRKALDAGGVAQPKWQMAGGPADAGSVHAGSIDAGSIDVGSIDVGFPCVLKPLSLSGSQGVIRADTPEEARAAAARIRAILGDPDAPLLVEQFVPGDEVAVEALLTDGRLEVLAVFDKPDPLDGPYFEETIYVTPSRKPAATLAEIERTTAHAARALGLTEGPVHAEMRVDEQGNVTVLELAARSIGGLCSRSLRFGLGVSLEEVILRHALGLDPGHLIREERASGVMMLPIPRAGTLREVRGQDEARKVPGIAGLELSIARGRPVKPLPDGDRYLGFLFAKAGTPEEVEAALREAHGHLEVDIEES